jgi:GH15 family glucan-1,4-alpha-glucosidase
MYDNNVRTITENILRINLKDASKDTTLWTVVTVWRSDYSSAIANEDKSDVLVDEIMVSFL